jgi:hypothetical protein
MGNEKRGNNYRHGMVGTRTYSSWSSMMRRCNNPNEKAYATYGAVGIKVCKRWHTFKNFFEDMGVRPEGMSLDRINGRRGYSPDNCRWATESEQQKNRKDNVYYTLRGKTLCVQDWGREVGIHPDTIRSRVKKGWEIEKAVFTPVGAFTDIHRPITFNGVTLSRTDWSKRLGCKSPSTIKARLDAGWSIARALTTSNLQPWQGA